MSISLNHIEGPVLIYDGDCAMCNQSVQFILKHLSSHSKMHFAPRSLLDFSKYSIKNYDSLIYYDPKKDHSHYYSSAVVLASNELKKPYRYLSVLLWITPKFIRDFFYKIIAKNRKKLFKKEVCLLIPETHKHRILS